MKSRSHSALLLMAMLIVMLSSESLLPASAQTSTPTPTPTMTETPSDPNDTLIIDQPSDFPPDLLAAISIGTNGGKPSLWCAIFIEDGNINFNDSPVEVYDMPDSRLDLPSICSNTEISSPNVQVFAPNGSQTRPALFSDMTFTGIDTTYVAALPLSSVLTPGQWRISVTNPARADLLITMPPITETIFLRGTLTTGLLAGFQPNEQVRAFAYILPDDGEDTWRFTESFQFSVNQYGYRFIALDALQQSSIVFVGQDGSFYISNGKYSQNGNSRDPRFPDPGLIEQVWAYHPAANPPKTQPPPMPNPNVQERIDAHGVKQVYVPQGCFTMGSDALGDISDQIRGHSQRLVCITHSFWIDKYEVSNAQWEQFRLLSGSPLADLDTFPSSMQPDMPRVGMTLQQAEAYAQWRGGSIPTEAEWEYAARGPNAPLYPWGNPFNNQANVLGVTNGAVPVQSFSSGASWVGAFNMAGNAGEWVSDCYSENYDALKVQYDPQGPCDGSNEMVKGSSFAFNQLPAQSAYRFVNPPGRSWFDVGLRVINPAT